MPKHFMINRLAQETSPYLRQHADNPVDWYPWGDEAFERAAREDRPVLVSIGYSACHWCHVMAHESFEDPRTAEVMNRLFVNVKVDREERPDLDQIYQAAHQLLARRPGGWPLTMALCPDRTPFFAGTYFPDEARHGMPAFADLCERLGAIWRERRADIETQNVQVLAALARLVPDAPTQPVVPDRAPWARLRGTLEAQFDAGHGGFGDAPKFPHPTDLEFCLRCHAENGDAGALGMARATLLGMCRGGLYDHLGGGFCRYSTDARWEIPHFEKMLSDNGLLLGVLADAWAATGEARFAACAEETAGWLVREMQSPEGGYYAALDADSEGEEGRYYVWQRDEVHTLLPGEAWRVVAPYYGLDRGANFEGRAWHLYEARTLDAAAAAAGVDAALAATLVAAARARLREARDARPRPARDEKIITAWNALAIRGMARAGRVFGRDDWIASARRAAAFVRARLWTGSGADRPRLLATYKDGRARLNGYLDDHAFMLAAMLELLQAGFEVDGLEFAQALADVMLEQFEDTGRGGFYFTSRDHERLIARPKPGQDASTPSGNGMAAWALGRLAALTGKGRYATAAARTVAAFHAQLAEYGAGHAALCIALGEQLRPPTVVVLRGAPDACGRWARELARAPMPDTLVIALADATAGRIAGLPEVLDKPIRGTGVNAWVCRGVTCLEPIADLAELRRVCLARPQLP